MMACDECKEIVDVSDEGGPYVLRSCPSCKRVMKVRERDKDGKGIVIKAGDRFTIPAGWLQFSANPLKGNMYAYRTGIGWFAEKVFVGDNIGRPEDYCAKLDSLIADYEGLWTKMEALQGIDLNDETQFEAVHKIVESDKTKPEWWAYLAGGFAAAAKSAINANEPSKAAWASAASERFRALLVFKNNFEEAVWMGQSARRLRDLLRLWDSNKLNGDENFWQKELTEFSFTIAQLFSVPVTFIRGSAYVGGKSLDGNNARMLDMLLAGGYANDAILMEIKTPIAKLLGRRYRSNVFTPSAEVTGAIVQVADYCHTLQRHFNSLDKSAEVDLNAFSPRKVVLIGNSAELDTPVKKQSFQLFRGSLAGVEIVMFDELFTKIEHLAKLFNLVRTT